MIATTATGSTNQLGVDVATAQQEISVQVQQGHGNDLGQSYFYLDDKPLVASIAADIAALYGSQGHYIISDGFIPIAGDTSRECVALVQALDPNVGLTGTWRSAGGQQVDLNGGFNSNITSGSPIATFVNGTYPDADQHAGIFLGYGSEAGSSGFFMLDQYNNQPITPTSQCAEVRFYPFYNVNAPEYFTISHT